MLLNRLAPPPSLYGVPLDRITAGIRNRAATHLIYKSVRMYKAALRDAGFAGAAWESPHQRESNWFLTRLQRRFPSENSVDAMYRLFTTAVCLTRATLGLAPIDLPAPRRVPRKPRPSLSVEQELALRGHAIAELRRTAADFVDAAEARAWAITAGPPRTQDLDEMDYNELIRDVVHRRDGVFSKAMPDIGPVKSARLHARHRQGWRRLACLRGPMITDWMPFRSFLALEAAVNECVLNELKTDALQGSWLSGTKRRKGGDCQIAQLIKSRPPFSIEEAMQAALQIRQILADDSSEENADDLLLFRCRLTHRVRSFAEFNVELTSWTFEPLNTFLRRCSRRTGIDFSGINSMHIRATALRRIVDEEPTLEGAMLRTGHDNLDVLLGYLEPEHRALKTGLSRQPTSQSQVSLIEDAAAMFSLEKYPRSADAFRTLASRSAQSSATPS